MDPYQASYAKAEALLLDHLSPSQRFTYQKWAFFYVRGNDNRLYALTDGYWITLVEGKTTQRLGVHPYMLLPRPDQLLAQKLMLETNAKACRKMACLGDSVPSPRSSRFLEVAGWNIDQEILDDARAILTRQYPQPGRWKFWKRFP